MKKVLAFIVLFGLSLLLMGCENKDEKLYSKEDRVHLTLEELTEIADAISTEKQYFKLTNVINEGDLLISYLEYGYLNFNSNLTTVISELKEETTIHDEEGNKIVNELQTIHYNPELMEVADEYFYASINVKGEDQYFKNGKFKTTNRSDFWQLAMFGNRYRLLGSGFIKNLDKATIIGKDCTGEHRTYLNESYFVVEIEEIRISEYGHTKSEINYVLIFKNNKLYEYEEKYNYYVKYEDSDEEDFTFIKSRKIKLTIIDTMPEFNTEDYIEFDNLDELIVN